MFEKNDVSADILLFKSDVFEDRLAISEDTLCFGFIFKKTVFWLPLGGAHLQCVNNH